MYNLQTASTCHKRIMHHRGWVTLREGRGSRFGQDQQIDVKECERCLTLRFCGNSHVRTDL